MQISSGWLPNADNDPKNVGLVTTTTTTDDANDDASWQQYHHERRRRRLVLVTTTTTGRNANLIGFWSVYVYSNCTRIGGYTFCFVTENQSHLTLRSRANVTDFQCMTLVSSTFATDI